VIRVLHVITRLTVGGSPENTVATVVALARAGYACTLAVSFRESVEAVLEDARRRGCRLVDVPSLGREVALASDVAAVYRLLRLIGADRPHIVHTHTSKAGFVGRLAARIARVPAVIHQPHGHVFYGYWGPGRTAVYTALERLAAAWCDRIITLTERGTEEHGRVGRVEVARRKRSELQFAVVLRRVMVEADAIIQGKRAGDAPGVLEIQLEVLEEIIAARAPGGFGVSVVAAQERVGVGVVRVVLVGGVPVELDGAAGGGIGVLYLARALQINPRFENMRAGDVADVIHE